MAGSSHSLSETVRKQCAGKERLHSKSVRDRRSDVRGAEGHTWRKRWCSADGKQRGQQSVQARERWVHLHTADVRSLCAAAASSAPVITAAPSMGPIRNIVLSKMAREYQGRRDGTTGWGSLFDGREERRKEDSPGSAPAVHRTRKEVQAALEFPTKRAGTLVLPQISRVASHIFLLPQQLARLPR